MSMMGLPTFAKRVRYSAQECVVIKMADWTVKQDRPDLCLCLYSMAVGAGILSEEFKMPPRHVTFLSAEYPNAFSEGVSIEFSVILTEETE